MDTNTIKETLAQVIPLSIDDGYVARKMTVVDTVHVGKLSGNRLNSGTLRSQYIVFPSVAMWDSNDLSAKRSLHSDQRIFVQKRDDVWDVYRGANVSSENEDPVLIARNAQGLASLITAERVSLRGGLLQRRENLPLQIITYGAPGTGKSHGIENVVGTYEDTIRTTFHPDSDYSTFVGAYKPTMNASRQIEYVFRPQAFTNAYVQAWKKMTETDAANASLPEPQYLVIEEINRGNCAQIFGDLFQLLDRKDDGYSKYPIDADIDLATHVATELGTLPADAQERIPSEVRSGKKLQLPPNLYIWATMNTSDQSLFPIDSAFKRRWDWKYIPIAKPNEEGWKDRKIVANGKAYDWWDFISIVNTHIAKVTKSEDKQMGYFFVKAPDDTGHITAERFANKVLFYLFNDVFKDWDLPVAIFGKNGQANEKYAFKEFFYAEKTANHNPGDVKEEVVAAFIERQESEGKTVNARSLASNTGNSESPANPESVPPQAQ